MRTKLVKAHFSLTLVSECFFLSETSMGGRKPTEFAFTDRDSAIGAGPKGQQQEGTKKKRAS